MFCDSRIEFDLSQNEYLQYNMDKVDYSHVLSYFKTFTACVNKTCGPTINSPLFINILKYMCLYCTVAIMAI